MVTINSISVDHTNKKTIEKIADLVNDRNVSETDGATWDFIKELENNNYFSVTISLSVAKIRGLACPHYLQSYYLTTNLIWFQKVEYMKAFDIIKMMIINMLNFILYYLYMYLLGNSDYFFPCVFILLLVFLCTVIRNKSSCIYWIISYFLIIPYACIILQKNGAH